jgi:hypothetical protein
MTVRHVEPETADAGHVARWPEIAGFMKKTTPVPTNSLLSLRSAKLPPVHGAVPSSVHRSPPPGVAVAAGAKASVVGDKAALRLAPSGG